MQENGGSSIAEMAGKLQQVLPSLAKKRPLSEGDKWVLQRLCEEVMLQGSQAQEWVPGSTVASPPLAPVGIPARGLQGRAQVHVLWDSAKPTQEQMTAEGRARAQAGGQTIITIPACSTRALGTRDKEAVV